jgi:hypothetical protein
MTKNYTKDIKKQCFCISAVLLTDFENGVLRFISNAGSSKQLEITVVKIKTALRFSAVRQLSITCALKKWITDNYYKTCTS